MMHKLDPTVSANFYRKDTTNDKDKFPGVADLLPGSETDEFNFTPCGYSMNGLKKEAYYTIHVTPEPICSYASFETNISMASYSQLINQVLQLFKPGTFTVTFFSEKPTSVAANPEPFEIDLPGYVRKHKTFSELGDQGTCDILMLNYESLDYAERPRAPKKIKFPAVQTIAHQVEYSFTH